MNTQTAELPPRVERRTIDPSISGRAANINARARQVYTVLGGQQASEAQIASAKSELLAVALAALELAERL